MTHMLQAPIILLKDGTDTSQGKAQVISNINACRAIVDILRTTLGPRGMDKLLHNERDVTITNDGATVMSLLNVIHPAASILVDIAKSQDDEVGDGTTSVVILAGELLQEAKGFIEEGVHPQIIIKGYKKAAELAIEALEGLQINLTTKTEEEKTVLLRKCAETALNSKLVAFYKQFFAKMVVDAVLMLDSQLDKSLIGIKKVTGGSCMESMLIDGVAFKKTFSYAGFEQQPKKFQNAKILLLNVELELKAEKENAEVRLENPDDYQSIVDAEWKVIYEKLDTIVNSGANVVFSKLPIGDLATQHFADRDIFCAGRVEEGDMKRTALATGGKVQNTVNNLSESVLGCCGEFEEIRIGSERFNILKKCRKTSSATIILRGGAQQFVEEAERSLHDAIMIVRRILKTSYIVGGGGAIEMEISQNLREQSRSMTGKEHVLINVFAKCLEVIPKVLAHNSGYDSTDILNKLRQKHANRQADSRWYGVNCLTGNICDTRDEYIWEASTVKKNALYAATEAACLVLSVDETIRCPPSQASNDTKGYNTGARNLAQRALQRAGNVGRAPMRAFR